MPRYYFDIDDGEGLLPDGDGVEFDDIAKAKAQAVRVLPAIALDKVEGADRTFKVALRTGDGEVVFRAAFSLAVEDLG